MARPKLLVTAIAILCFTAIAATSFAKPTSTCPFNGDYSFFFWSPDNPVAGVGFFSVRLNAGQKCRSGVVLPGGIINCNVDGAEFEDFIEDGFVFLETDGAGTMEIETNSSKGVCGTGDNAFELDISVVQNGKRMMFNSNAVSLVQSGTVHNAGDTIVVAGRATKCFAGPISGCYDIHFWEPDASLAGDCTVCVGGGVVSGGTCRCNNEGTEYLSEIEAGGYTLGEDCQSSTGFLSFTVSSDEVCGLTSTVRLDFAVAAQGAEFFGACDSANTFDCAFEGWKQ
jgi:hypothetical protein